MSAPWKLILPSLLLGIIVGAVGGVWVQRRAFNRVPDTERTLRRLTGKLGLDKAQQTAVRVVLEERRVKLTALREGSMAKTRGIRLKGRAEIRKLLRPEQQTVYDALMLRVDARHKDMPPDRKEAP